ncbi:A disintegrin and metalloproteinase with thrombospondin motifs 7-like [Haliotis cracherodii]|uniref:A disintegrin and metalloproteinase with thrombospondin motifs 7-like n=1 Tax=Haliotis cracherodii TaxID=6455 RepID=UPI0039E7C211
MAGGTTGTTESAASQGTACDHFMLFSGTQNDNCALVENVPGGSVLATNGMIAGQVTDADAQCARAFPGTRFCRRTTILDDMCQTILCGVDAGTGEDCPNSIVPVDRTSCGNQRWCVQGQCIQANGAPARAPNCPQGDDPNRSCNQARCPFSPVVCCETCGVVPPTVAFPTATGTTTTTTTVTASGASTATTSGTSVTSGVALSVVRFNIILC